MAEENKPGIVFPEHANSADFSSGKINIAPRHRTTRDWLRIFGISSGVLGCLLFMMIGTIWGRIYWSGGPLAHLVQVATRNIFSGRAPDADWQPDIQFPQRSAMNVLILGVDHDYDNRDQIIRTTNGRSDSIMLARVDFINNTIKALTIPRDTAVRIPEHSGIRKINAAHSLGGPPLTIETIKSVFGVDVDAYVVLNFEGFQDIVDAIGGIDVNVQVPRGHKGLDYDDNWGHLHIHLKPGYQHLNGYQAMGFVRMRHSDSDEMRSKRQHEFLEAMRAKVKQPSTLYNIPSIVNKIHDNLKRGMMTDDQLYTLVNFARKLPKENIEIQTLPSFEGPSYVTVDALKSEALIQRLFFPNQAYAYNIDAPDINSVRSQNSRYDKNAKHKNGKKAGQPAVKQPSVDSDDALDAGPAPLSMEDGASKPPAELNQKPADTKSDSKPDSKPGDAAPDPAKGGNDAGTKSTGAAG